MQSDPYSENHIDGVTEAKVASSNREEVKQRIKAVCLFVRFSNDSNGFKVAAFQDTESQEEFFGVGVMPFLDVDDRVVLDGVWGEHSTYGRQFKVLGLAPHIPRTQQDIISYLSSGSVKWIGPKLAERIVQEFGENSIDVMRNQPEALSKIKGISEKKAAEIAMALRETGAYQDLAQLLTPLGIGTGRVMAIFKIYGTEAISIISHNPYRLASDIDGIGFLTADRIAMHLGIKRKSFDRIAAAIRFVISGMDADGHTYITPDMLFNRLLSVVPDLGTSESEELFFQSSAGYSSDAIEDLYELDSLGMDSSDIEVSDINQSDPENQERIEIDELYRAAVAQLIESKEIAAYTITEEGEFQFIADVFSAKNVRIAALHHLTYEIKTAQRLTDIHHAGRTIRNDVFYNFSDEALYRKIDETSRDTGIILSDEQADALFMALRSRCCVITGGPGTGKTTILSVLVQLFEQQGQKLVLCAPTGRAAKRLLEACNHPAGTIHRLLEVGRSELDGVYMPFARNADNPIDADVFIVDESSMLDVSLTAALLDAIPSKGRIVFIGDKDQLPSVGPGNVLADIIASQVIPCVSLKKIYRQAEKSRIVLSAHNVIAGKGLVFDQTIDSDCMLVSKSGDKEIAEAVTRLYSDILPNRYGIHPVKDVVVLSPTRKSAAGTRDLNLRLQSAYGLPTDKSILSKGFNYRVGDRVMQIRNNYDLSYSFPGGATGMGIFNGELGIVSQIDTEVQKTEVIFDDSRVAVYEYDKIADLEPAYAMTVHKSQGCEFPAVILAVPPGFYRLNYRNLLYTAITRAKKHLFVVSDRKTLADMIANTSQAKRLTSLREFILAYRME